MYYDEAAYNRTKKNLEVKVNKLRANLTQMNDEEKKKYAKALKNLKKEILVLWNQLQELSHWSVRVPDEESENVQRVWNENYKKRLFAALFMDYSVDAAIALMDDFRMDVFMQYHGIVRWMFAEEETEIETA